MQLAKKKKFITPPSPVILPLDLISEVLSYLPVKYLVQLRSVCKSWKTLIYDPTFVKLQFKRAPTTNPLFTLTTHHEQRILGYKTQLYYYSVVPYPISCLIENPSFNLSVDPYYSLNDKECSNVVGTCNGLICLSGYSFTRLYVEYWLRLWNPVTRTISPKFGYFRDKNVFEFKFGYDNSTGKYKVVAFGYYNQKSNVRILSFGDNVWRDIEGLPVVPVHLRLHLNYDEYAAIRGVYLSGSFNWLAIRNINEYNYNNNTVEQFVIVSLDLETETYNQYMLPRGVDGVMSGMPTVSVLGGCLCFSYSYRETDFVIWQMKEFGVEHSWTQFLKISYQNLQLEYDISKPLKMYSFQLVPLLLSENGDTLVLSSIKDSNAILYNLSDNRVERTKCINSSTSNRTCWCMAMDFVGSLVSIV